MLIPGNMAEKLYRVSDYLLELKKTKTGVKKTKTGVQAWSGKLYMLQLEILKIYVCPGEKYELQVDLLRFQSPLSLTRLR